MSISSPDVLRSLALDSTCGEAQKKLEKALAELEESQAATAKLETEAASANDASNSAVIEFEKKLDLSLADI